MTCATSFCVLRPQRSQAIDRPESGSALNSTLLEYLGFINRSASIEVLLYRLVAGLLAPSLAAPSSRASSHQYKSHTHPSTRHLSPTSKYTSNHHIQPNSLQNDAPHNLHQDGRYPSPPSSLHHHCPCHGRGRHWCSPKDGWRWVSSCSKPPRPRALKRLNSTDPGSHSMLIDSSMRTAMLSSAARRPARTTRSASARRRSSSTSGSSSRSSRPTFSVSPTTCTRHPPFQIHNFV